MAELKETHIGAHGSISVLIRCLRKKNICNQTLEGDVERESACELLFPVIPQPRPVLYDPSLKSPVGPQPQHVLSYHPQKSLVPFDYPQQTKSLEKGTNTIDNKKF